MDNGKPTDTEERFLELLEPLAASAEQLYPGWRVHSAVISSLLHCAAQMRIYHNVTEADTPAFSALCRLHCTHHHVDLCDTRRLPGQLGDLNTKFPVGRFWRFQVVADPTVSIFNVRDVDSFLTPREVAAVGRTIVSNKPALPQLIL